MPYLQFLLKEEKSGHFKCTEAIINSAWSLSVSGQGLILGHAFGACGNLTAFSSSWMLELKVWVTALDNIKRYFSVPLIKNPLIAIKLEAQILHCNLSIKILCRVLKDDSVKKEGHLLCKHEDPSSNPYHPHIKLGCLYYAGNLHIGTCSERQALQKPSFQRSHLKEVM